MTRRPGDDKTVHVTIVGGRPPADEPQVTDVPQGMQNLLLMASEDPRLRDALVHERAETLERCGVLLSDSERKVLMSIPAERLQQMIHRLNSPQSERREFLRMAAASVVALLAGAVVPLLGSREVHAEEPDRLDGVTRGIRPDVPEPGGSPTPAPSRSPSPTPRPPEHSPTRGIRPDRPTPSPTPTPPLTPKAPLTPRPSPTPKPPSPDYPPPPTGHRPDVP